jgi:hypothetical protein
MFFFLLSIISHEYQPWNTLSCLAYSTKTSPYYSPFIGKLVDLTSFLLPRIGRLGRIFSSFHFPLVNKKIGGKKKRFLLNPKVSSLTLNYYSMPPECVGGFQRKKECLFLASECMFSENSLEPRWEGSLLFDDKLLFPGVGKVGVVRGWLETGIKPLMIKNKTSRG